ncbi:type IV pilus modification PilV family protein [Allochromatium palmeri]|uniref:Uncharacterized protein n=1 Tax=Allochromatium palmeri TaxID=231048 RepID=A0A6N8EHM1_9GAMM|nr:hypothetical protein [Allochromatium palmeri]MTW23111.1 hypothetical protein [Allochromatium palmeri]
MSIFHRDAMRPRGFALLDALISVVVLALGMTTVAALNGRLISDSSLAKNRAQAVALAQEKIEELRTNLVNNSTSAANNFFILASGSDNCSDNPSPYPCGSAGFQRAWTLSNHSAIPNSKNVRVSVTWTDSQNQAQSVVLSSLVTWDNPLMQNAATDDQDFMNLGGFPDPTGGGNLQLSNPTNIIGDNPTIAKDNAEFNLRVVEYEGGVAVYDPTITNENQVWLTTDPGVIEIKGNIKLSTLAPPNNFENDAMLGNLRSIAADAGICREIVNNNETTSDTSDDYLDFLCYVGSNWYGRIGIMAVNDGQMINIEHVGNGNNADRLCPHTYRYGSNCAVTGNFSLTSSPEGQINYCLGSATNPNFVPVTTVVLNTQTEEPMLFGTLMGQDFVIQDSDTPCSGTLSISGTINLSGDSTRGIVKNVISATPSGATSGCTVFENDSNPTSGNYLCYVPEGWSGNVTFTAENCSGLPAPRQYSALTADQTAEDINISNCIGDTITIRGSIANLDLALDPDVVFKDGLGNAVGGIICYVPGSNSADYECTNIPGSATGQVVVNAENCSSEITSTSASYTEDTSVNITGWDEVTCSKIDYVINGTFTLLGTNKWEVGSGNSKESVKPTLTGCMENPTITLDRSVYTYSCKVTSYPNRPIEITGTACPEDGFPCMTVTPSPLEVNLGNTNPIPQKNFNVSP